MTGALVLVVLERELGLQQRDDRVEQRLRAAIDDARYRAAKLHQEARELDAQVRRIEQAVVHERWWQLRGYLSAADVDSLCNVSPKGLLDRDRS